MEEIDTEVGTQGLNVTMVMLWQPGMNKHPTLGEVVDFAPFAMETRRITKRPGPCGPGRLPLNLLSRLSANEVDVSQFWLERVTLNSLNFYFFFFAIDNDGQNFTVELSFALNVPQFVLVQLDCYRSSFTAINDGREFVSCTQAAARTLTLLFTYFCVDSKH
ncbi:Uncharacterised protein [Raoultella ornithinolytica]|nr:Uncharacterised protein [Raoultella ornithinolytica]